MSELDPLYEIRDFRESDKSFIMATFLRGLWYDNKFYGLIPKDIFMDNYKLVVSALLQKRTVKVACLKEDSEVILGYSILSNDFNTIDWVFVKKVWRHQGVGQNLVPKFITAYSHFSSKGITLLKHYPTAVFNPFL